MLITSEKKERIKKKKIENNYKGNQILRDQISRQFWLNRSAIIWHWHAILTNIIRSFVQG